MSILDVFRRGTDADWSREDFEERKKTKALIESGELIQDDPGTGVREVHWAPRQVAPEPALAPSITRTPPTTPGWWAVRRIGSPDWSIVEVVYALDTRLYWAYGPHEAARRAASPGYEWSSISYVLPA